MEGTKQFNFNKKLSTSTEFGITAKTSSTYLYQTNSKSTTDGNKSLSKYSINKLLNIGERQLPIGKPLI